MSDNLKSTISQLPKSPGVYIFRDVLGEILYIGKAISLRDRVRSYLSPNLGEERGRQLEEMVKRVKMVEIKETRFEVEALLLEAKLIRREKPFYNIRLRDDKSFAVIVIDRTSDFPQITTAREVDIERICAKLKRERSSSISQKIAKVEYFGPYPSTGSAKHALSTLRRAFKFRDCSPVKFRHYQRLERGCLFQSIHLCDAPCVGAISKQDYNRSIDNIRNFLRGNHTKVIHNLEAEMKKRTKTEEFEIAANLRDQIFALSKIQMQAKIAVEATRGVVYPEKKIEDRRKKITRDFRIEAFDISNISGEFAVGAMVVGLYDPSSQRLEFVKQFYRRFKIRTVDQSNDLAMMQEVLTRRLRHLADQSQDWAQPDLIFIDGGRTHLRVAQRVFDKFSNKKLGVRSEKLAQKKKKENRNQKIAPSIPIVAVAKGKSRKKVDLYMNSKVREQFQDVDLEKIAEKMREEAHRFAIGYYRTLHRKDMVGKLENKKYN